MIPPRLFTTRPRLRQGIYSGVIVARSSDQPGTGFTYTVSVALPDSSSVRFVGVAPLAEKRLSNYFDIDLVPFKINTLVVVHVLGPEHRLKAYIGEGEPPNAGPCPPQGG